MKGIDENVKASRCASADVVPRLQTLRLVANDIEPAFADEIKDPQFNRYAADLRAAADAALAAPPASCKAASETLSSLGKACDSCHRDFRSRYPDQGLAALLRCNMRTRSHFGYVAASARRAGHHKT
jgi:hypothetical protein